MVRKSIAALAAVVLTVLFAAWAETRPASSLESQAQSSSTAPSGPAFVQANKKYTIRWQPGDSEVYAILEVRGGWARAKRDAGSAAQDNSPVVETWLNLNEAITITEQR